MKDIILRMLDQEFDIVWSSCFSSLCIVDRICFFFQDETFSRFFNSENFLLICLDDIFWIDFYPSEGNWIPFLGTVVEEKVG
jgi:hypothetical protein